MIEPNFTQPTDKLPNSSRTGQTTAPKTPVSQNATPKQNLGEERCTLAPERNRACPYPETNAAGIPLSMIPQMRRGRDISPILPHHGYGQNQVTTFSENDMKAAKARIENNDLAPPSQRTRATAQQEPPYQRHGAETPYSANDDGMEIQSPRPQRVNVGNNENLPANQFFANTLKQGLGGSTDPVFNDHEMDARNLARPQRAEWDREEYMIGETRPPGSPPAYEEPPAYGTHRNDNQGNRNHTFDSFVPPDRLGQEERTATPDGPARWIGHQPFGFGPRDRPEQEEPTATAEAPTSWMGRLRNWSSFGSQ